ncbi:MAG TPA: DUF952 domain-containing protein [Thermomicrobiales bacterium]|nr:DUF952 domain-containing protein [Thermomicrobiales bacterium]
MSHYRTAEESREAAITYHLVPVAVWEGRQDKDSYTPEAFETDGFIHCTNGTDEVIAVGNLFYTGDPRSFQVLALDVNAIEPDVRYDAPGEVYPHIYGALNTSAVVAILPVERDDSGTFLRVGRDS